MSDLIKDKLNDAFQRLVLNQNPEDGDGVKERSPKKKKTKKSPKKKKT